MAELDRRYAQGTTVGRAETGVIDQGLRAYMLRVYNYMASGVAITGVVAYLTYAMAVVETATGLQLTPFGNFIFASAFKWVVIFAPLAMVFFLSARINSMSLSGAQIAFWVFAALMGLLWLSTVPPTNGLVAIMFGTRHLGLLGGIVFFSHQIGSFLGVWLGGYLYDHFKTYDPVWWIGVALGIFAAIVHWPIQEKPVERLRLAPAE